MTFVVLSGFETGAKPCFLNRSKITQYLQACLLMGDPGDDPGDYGVDEAPAIFPTPAAGHFDVSGIAETWKRPAKFVFPRISNCFSL
jgi:hypothetical protein